MPKGGLGERAQGRGFKALLSKTDSDDFSAQSVNIEDAEIKNNTHAEKMNGKRIKKGYQFDEDLSESLRVFCFESRMKENHVVQAAIWEYIHKPKTN